MATVEAEVKAKVKEVSEVIKVTKVIKVEKAEVEAEAKLNTVTNRSSIIETENSRIQECKNK